VVEAFQNPSMVPWSIWGRWKCCLAMCNILNFEVSHIFREGNRCIHRLANLGVESKIEFVCLDALPSCVGFHFFRNKFGLPEYMFS